MAENKNIEVGGRLHSIATGNVLAGANEIFDDGKNKKQSQINTETYSLIEEVNAKLNTLSPDQQAALDVAGKANNNEVKLGYYVCGTEGNVAAKVIPNITGYVLSVGGSMKVKMTNANTADNATLNINSTGAKALYYDGERASANNSWGAGETVEIYYDGTSYYANSVAGGTSDGVFDVSIKYPTSGVEGGNTYTLGGALAVLNANLSDSKKKGGMRIQFIQSSDNKYVRFNFLLSGSFTDAQFTNVANWQGVDALPILDSENIVKSGGVASAFKDISRGYISNVIFSGNCSGEYDWLEDVNIPQGHLIHNCGEVAVNFYNVKNVSQTVRRFSLAPGESIITEYDVVALRDLGQSGSYSVVVYKDTFLSDIEYLKNGLPIDGIVDYITDFNLVDNPARKDGSNSLSGYFDGYKVDLTNYANGLYSVVFRGSQGSDYSSDNAAVAGIVIDSNGAVESYVKDIGTYKNDVVILPLTVNSRTLWATYCVGSPGGEVWSPKAVAIVRTGLIKKLFTNEDAIGDINDSVEEINGSLSQLTNIVESHTGDINDINDSIDELEEFKDTIYDDCVSFKLVYTETYQIKQTPFTLKSGSVIKSIRDTSTNTERQLTARTEATDQSYISITRGTRLDRDINYLKSSTITGEFVIEIFKFSSVGFVNENIIVGGSTAKKPSLSDGESLSLTKYPQDNHSGDKITFGCKITTLDRIRFEFGYNTDYARWFVIDDTNISLYGGVNPATAVDTQAHGLTFETMINVHVNVNNDGEAEVTIQTQNGYYQHTFASFGMYACGRRRVTSLGSSLTDCRLSATNEDFSRPVWIFGASFEGSLAYWVKWLRQLGYKNYLVNGYPGRGSTGGEGAYSDLLRALNCGLPKYLYWTMFGNDSTDEEFATYLNTVSALCKYLGITPIFTLRPDTPTRNYQNRRTAVLSTGERYVDLQAALQKTLYADGGEWYDGFLDVDGMHPTEAGSKAILMQVLKDFPELIQ